MRGRGHDIWRWGRELRFKSIFWYWLHLGQIHFQLTIWELRAAIVRRRDTGGCEEVPSYQLPSSEGLLNREPDAALDGRDGPNHCILFFDELAFSSRCCYGFLAQSKKAWEEGWREEKRKKMKSEREREDHDDLILRTGRSASHSDTVIKISSVIVCLIIKRFETQLPSKPPASPQDRELSDRWYRRHSLNGIFSTAKIQ